MNLQSLNFYGESLVGKTAQCRLLCELSATGKKVISAPQKITAYEIVEVMREPTLMVTLGGESVFEDLIFNVSK